MAGFQATKQTYWLGIPASPDCHVASSPNFLAVLAPYAATMALGQAQGLLCDPWSPLILPPRILHRIRLN